MNGQITGSNSTASLIISYLTLRKAIGYLAVSFPFILVIGAYALNDDGLQNSISSYYYTNFTGDVFVGILFTIGFILFAYKGYESKDDIAGDFACLCVLCVALFPTEPVNPPPDLNPLISIIHYCAAAFFFLTLIYFCLFLFVKGDVNPTPQKLKRNKIYISCGITMLLCITGIAVHALLSKFVNEGEPLIFGLLFWLETICVVAFGVSWLVKGEAILKD